jgi:hypothetical protein
MPIIKGVLHRACGQCTTAGDECAECSKNRRPLQSSTQTLELETRNSGGVPPIVHEVLRSPGQPLDAETRAFMEPRFGHDFSRVRVHTDSNAAESARAVNALAYTVGRDVVFGVGSYAPHTAPGRLLLAHELAHVAQSAVQVAAANPLAVGRADSWHEREAEEMGQLALRPALSDGPMLPPLSPVFSPLVQRQSSASAAVGASAVGSSVSSAGDTGPIPAPTGGSGGGGTCKVDVGATHIGGFLSLAPIWHTLVIYTDTSGNEYFYRAGPGGSCPGVTTGTYGTIQSTSGRYVAGTIDYPASHRTTALTGAAACGKDSCFSSELSRIDGRCVPYAATGPNSNTVARTLLATCGVPQVKPVSVAPGWGDPVL